MSSGLRFEWDDTKNAENRRKHGIDFEEAAEIFNGPILTHTDDRAGAIRMISARKATERERSIFHAYLERALG